MDNIYNGFDEKKLLLLLKNNDRKAFSTLYHSYVTPLRHFIIRIAKSPELTDDIIHDTFIKVWEYRSNIDSDLPFKTLLFTIGKRVLLNLFKRAQHEQLILAEIKKHTIIYHHETDDTISYNESNLLLNEAINQLPKHCREVFIKCRLEGASYKEVSAELGIAESTINNQMVKALKSIRKYLTVKSTAVVVLIMFLKLF
jgi:RNA polymerase sigma-70 factor (ECF subfamily)